MTQKQTLASAMHGVAVEVERIESSMTMIRLLMLTLMKRIDNLNGTIRTLKMNHVRKEWNGKRYHPVDKA